MTPRFLTALLLLACTSAFAADDYQPGPDSLPQAGVAKGQMLKDTYLAKDISVFPGTEREYQIYLPAGLDKSKPAPFMVFQDGVIYQAPTAFDNLIARHDIPAMIGIFIKPGVVPAANADALPRYNRSYEYDSVTDSYSRFLIDEFLPAIKAKHKLSLSDDPNARGIAGNSSGGICAFMVAWHRPDQFRRVFSGVGTYVGIHGADQLPVLVRKYEPKPLRVFLQSGENDNNLYCGDWWMANQMMERSLSWNGYDVNHAWGTGGHNAKHASQILPEVLRWLWKGYPEEPVKANPRGDTKWVGGQVVGDGEWEVAWIQPKTANMIALSPAQYLASAMSGEVYASLATDREFRYSKPAGIHHTAHTRWVAGGLAVCRDALPGAVFRITADTSTLIKSMTQQDAAFGLCVDSTGSLIVATNMKEGQPSLGKLSNKGEWSELSNAPEFKSASLCLTAKGRLFATDYFSNMVRSYDLKNLKMAGGPSSSAFLPGLARITLSPDQTLLFATSSQTRFVYSAVIDDIGAIRQWQPFGELQPDDDSISDAQGLCVDTNGWLYVATSLGIQVLDQAGRVNFIIPTPQQPHDVCFGGKDLSDLFIACGDKIYKRHTKAHGYISGQMAPIKPPGPKL